MEGESMEIKTFWVITKPTEISGLGDICFESTPQRIGLQFLGGLTCGDVVKRIRKRLGLTQVELAKKIGASEVSVIRWENSKCKPMAFYERQILELAKKRGAA
jgi:DNA-binding XRE family transcriptional regulator